MKKQADIDWPTVLKLFAGGALVGGGLGAGTSFFRYLNDLKQRAQPDTGVDDDVLYLHLPKAPAAIPGMKMSSANTTGTFITGGVGGVLGTILAYNAVRNLYQKQRKKKLQEELDRSQNIYLGNLSTQSEKQKQASQFGMLTKGVGGVGLALVLAALGSGIAANRLLTKQFPAIKKPNRDRPRKIVIMRDKPKDTDEEPEPEVVKGNVSPDMLENVARTSMNMPKVANADGCLADLVGAVAAGRGQEIKENILDLGVESTLDLIKGARFEKVGSLRRNLAFTWIANDPVVSTAMGPLIAAEFQEGGGEWFMKAAREIPREYHDALVGMAEAGTQECRAAIYKNFQKFDGVKQAAGLASNGLMRSILLAGGVGALLDNDRPAQPTGQPMGQSTASDTTDSPGDTNTPESQDSELPDVELSDEHAKRFWEQNRGLIDRAIQKV